MIHPEVFFIIPIVSTTIPEVFFIRTNAPTTIPNVFLSFPLKILQLFLQNTL